MNKVVHWVDFVRFITDKDIWSRWTFQCQMDIEGNSSETYFIEHWAAARANRVMAGFDFSKTNIQVMSKDESSVNWDHDGESLWYFFQKWFQGERV